MITAKPILVALMTLGLTLSGSQVRADAPEGEKYVLVIKKVSVHKTNSENEAWDLNNGAPDLQVIVTNLNKKDQGEEKTKTTNDVYETTFDAPMKLKVSQGDTLEFKIVDKDFDLDDEIGKVQKKIDGGGSMKLEKFGRVIHLEIELKKIS